MKFPNSPIARAPAVSDDCFDITDCDRETGLLLLIFGIVFKLLSGDAVAEVDVVFDDANGVRKSELKN